MIVHACIVPFGKTEYGLPLQQQQLTGIKNKKLLFDLSIQLQSPKAMNIYLQRAGLLTCLLLYHLPIALVATVVLWNKQRQ